MPITDYKLYNLIFATVFRGGLDDAWSVGIESKVWRDGGHP